MDWNHHACDRYDTLPMQAALQLYLPHVVEPDALSHRELPCYRLEQSRPRPAARRRRHTHHIW